MCCDWPGIRQSWDRVDINGLFITPRSNLWNAVKACAHVNNDSAVAVILILISVQINSVVELWAKKLACLILLSALFVYLQSNSFRNRIRHRLAQYENRNPYLEWITRCWCCYISWGSSANWATSNGTAPSAGCSVCRNWQHIDLCSECCWLVVYRYLWMISNQYGERIRQFYVQFQNRTHTHQKQPKFCVYPSRSNKRAGAYHGKFVIGFNVAQNLI